MGMSGVETGSHWIDQSTRSGSRDTGSQPRPPNYTLRSASSKVLYCAFVSTPSNSPRRGMSDHAEATQ